MRGEGYGVWVGLMRVANPEPSASTDSKSSFTSRRTRRRCTCGQQGKEWGFQGSARPQLSGPFSGSEELFG
eukprot:SAG11_NODE_494_length_8948_cov_2.882699_10_plen_71_part_00